MTDNAPKLRPDVETCGACNRPIATMYVLAHRRNPEAPGGWDVCVMATKELVISKKPTSIQLGDPDFDFRSRLQLHRPGKVTMTAESMEDWCQCEALVLTARIPADQKPMTILGRPVIEAVPGQLPSIGDIRFGTFDQAAARRYFEGGTGDPQ